MKYTCAVVKGKGRGKSTVKFPTFNLQIPPVFEHREGVYACRLWIGQDEYRGALHYGPTPTFDDTDKALEIFVLEYQDAGESVPEITFELGPYLRPIATFLKVEDLRNQIALDVQRVRKATFTQ